MVIFMKKNNIDKKMEKTILDYGKRFKTLTTFVEKVRTRPGMYIGPIGDRGFLNMIREIFQNSFDELIRGSKGLSPCTEVTIYYDERTHVVAVEDNGQGIPLNLMEDVYTKEFTSTNYEKKLYEYTSGLNGVGAKVVAVLSSKFIARSYVLGKAKELIIVNGVTQDKPKNIPANGKQGTYVEFVPEYSVLGNITLKGESIFKLIKFIVPQLNIGAKVNFKCIKEDGSKFTDTIVNTEGIVAVLIERTSKPLIAPIYISGDTGKMKADIVFTFDSNDLSEEDIIAFSNFCPTVQGTHINGFISGICDFFRNYMNKIYLGKNTKLTVINSDVKTGLKAMINAAHLEPNFTGQAKEILSNEDMYEFVYQLTLDSLNNWYKTNTNDINKVCKFLKEIAEIRVKSEEGKVKLTTKYETSVLSDLPRKYERPTGKTDLEFIIVEGDSALGSAKGARCQKRQGIFPIRGKIPNAMTKKPQEIFSNQEIAGITKIIGCGYGRNFDISKLKFDKIIPMTDADPDGSHIQNLILIFFLMYMPQLITNGYVYKAIPPLFGYKEKNHYKYFTRKIDFIAFVQRLFAKNNIIIRNNGNKMTENQTIDLFYRNDGYLEELEKVSTTFALDPKLLELVLINKEFDFKHLKKAVEKQFRFMKLSKSKSGIIIGEGLVNQKDQTLILSDTLYRSCNKIIHYMTDINDGEILFKMNNNPVTLYDIMLEFRKSTPSGIKRYKGLGEMNPAQLAESAIHPDGGRSLIRYTTEDIKKEIEQIKFLNSNTKEILKDLNISRRDIL